MRLSSFEELQEKGYHGGKIAVRTFVARLRQGRLGMALWMPMALSTASNG